MVQDLFQFPLAVYLCAFAGPKVFYTYSVWYDVRQHVPNPGNPQVFIDRYRRIEEYTLVPNIFQDSQFPDNFTQFLDMNPGPPLEEPLWEGRRCSRRFEHFKISVNLEDENSATWSDY